MEARSSSPKSSRLVRIGTNSMQFPSIHAPVICFRWLFPWILAYVVIVWCLPCRICWRTLPLVMLSFAFCYEKSGFSELFMLCCDRKKWMREKFFYFDFRWNEDEAWWKNGLNEIGWVQKNLLKNWVEACECVFIQFHFC